MRVLLILAVSALTLPAQKVTVEFDQAAGFRGYRTFSIGAGQIQSKSPALNNDLVRKRIAADIERELSARGLSAVNSGKADLVVRYTLGSSKRTEIEQYPAGWRGLGTRVVRVPYTEGTLVIDLRDTVNRSLVWRAIATEEKRDPRDVEKKLDKMVKKAIGKYPPK